MQASTKPYLYYEQIINGLINIPSTIHSYLGNVNLIRNNEQRANLENVNSTVAAPLPTEQGNAAVSSPLFGWFSKNKLADTIKEKYSDITSSISSLSTSSDKTLVDSPDDKTSLDKTLVDNPNDSSFDKASDHSTDKGQYDNSEVDSSDDKASDDNASDDNASDDKASDDKASDDKASDDKASDDKASDDKPSDDKPSDDKPSDDKPSIDTDNKSQGDSQGDSQEVTSDNTLVDSSDKSPDNKSFDKTPDNTFSPILVYPTKKCVIRKW